MCNGSLLSELCFLKSVGKKRYILEWFSVSLVYTVLVESFFWSAFYTSSISALLRLKEAFSASDMVQISVLFKLRQLAQSLCFHLIKEGS